MPFRMNVRPLTVSPFQDETSVVMKLLPVVSLAPDVVVIVSLLPRSPSHSSRKGIRQAEPHLTRATSYLVPEMVRR